MQPERNPQADEGIGCRNVPLPVARRILLDLAHSSQGSCTSYSNHPISLRQHPHMRQYRPVFLEQETACAGFSPAGHDQLKRAVEDIRRAGGTHSPAADVHTSRKLIKKHGLTAWSCRGRRLGSNSIGCLGAHLMRCITIPLSASVGATRSPLYLCLLHSCGHPATIPGDLLAVRV